MSAAREHLPPGFEWEEGDIWLIDQYGGQPVTPRELADDEDEEDFARIGAVNFLLEPLVWFFVGFALHGTGWRTIWDILGYWMVLVVMLPLRLMDTDKPRDNRFRLQYIVLQLTALGAGIFGWAYAGGR